MLGDNAAVQDVELLNSWNGVNATLAHRHYIARVQGQPVNIGLFIDQTYDIGRVEGGWEGGLTIGGRRGGGRVEGQRELTRGRKNLLVVTQLA
jgi:hypothetical protein